jgi:pimeloyl-ACP methyl ester carboxylesterase
MTASFATSVARPACVLLHSSMSSRSQWNALAAQQESALRCVAVDLLGYGKAPFPTAAQQQRFSLEHEVEAVLTTLADELAPDEPFHLVGHSYGGATALRLARRLLDTGRILSLTLFEPVAFHLLAPHDHARMDIENIIARIEAAATPRDGTAAFIDYWNGPGAFAALPAAMQERFTAQIAKVRLDFVALMSEPVTLADMATLDIPTLVLFGAQGPMSTRTVAEHLAAALPRAALHRTPGGHMAPITHAADVNGAIAAFIAASIDAARE